MVITVNIEHLVTDREQEALKELLPHYKNYVNPQGGRPFENWTIEDLYQALTQSGDSDSTSRNIKREQYAQGLIKTEEYLSSEKFRLKAERQGK